MKRIRKPLHCRADFSWLAPLVLACAAASCLCRCFLLAPLLLASAAGAARAREKASWRRRRVPFRGATGLPRCRCCGAKPRHATSAPQERGRLAGFREDSSLRQGLIAWNCGASQGKSKLAPPESSIPGRHRLGSAPLLRRQTKAYHLCAACREKSAPQNLV